MNKTLRTRLAPLILAVCTIIAAGSVFAHGGHGGGHGGWHGGGGGWHGGGWHHGGGWYGGYWGGVGYYPYYYGYDDPYYYGYPTCRIVPGHYNRFGGWIPRHRVCW